MADDVEILTGYRCQSRTALADLMSRPKLQPRVDHDKAAGPVWQDRGGHDADYPSLSRTSALYIEHKSRHKYHQSSQEIGSVRAPKLCPPCCLLEKP